MEATYPSVGGKLGNQMLGMVMYLVPPYAVGERGHVGIIAIDEYARFLLVEYGWK